LGEYHWQVVKVKEHVFPLLVLPVLRVPGPIWQRVGVACSAGPAMGTAHRVSSLLPELETAAGLGKE